MDKSEQIEEIKALTELLKICLSENLETYDVKYGTDIMQQTIKKIDKLIKEL